MKARKKKKKTSQKIRKKFQHIFVGAQTIKILIFLESCMVTHVVKISRPYILTSPLNLGIIILHSQLEI